MALKRRFVTDVSQSVKIAEYLASHFISHRQFVFTRLALSSLQGAGCASSLRLGCSRACTHRRSDPSACEPRGTETANGGLGDETANGGLSDDTANGGLSHDTANGGLGDETVDGGHSY